MVPAEGHGTWYSSWNIAYNCHYLIESHVGAATEMSKIVNADLQGMINESSYEEGSGQDEPSWHVLYAKMFTLTAYAMVRLSVTSESEMMMV